MCNTTIIEPRKDLCPSLARTVGQIPGYRVVGAHTSGKIALKCVEAESPRVIILDIELNDVNGFNLLGQLRERCPESHCIVYTNSSDTASVLRSFEQGANSYVLKKEGQGALVRASRLARDRQAYLSPQVATKLIKTSWNYRRKNSVLDCLTRRQLQIVRLVAKGKSNQEISDVLKVGEPGIRQHMHRIFLRLNIKSRTQLILLYWSIVKGISFED